MQTVYVITILSATKPTNLVFDDYLKAKKHYDDISGFAFEFGIEVYLQEETVIK